MSQTNILEIERKRKTNLDFTTIHLFVEGAFYRAYEWSAWLCCRYVNQFKPTKRENKSEPGDTIVYVGFPITSLSRYIPENSTCVTNDDKSVDIKISIDSVSEMDLEELQKDFFNWKNAVPITMQRKTTISDDLKGGCGVQPHRMSEILFKVLAFPVEQKTPMECMTFIAEIKNDIIALL